MFVKLLKNKMFRNSIRMEIQEKPPDDFFKGIKLSLKSVLKHPDINTPKITCVMRNRKEDHQRKK